MNLNGKTCRTRTHTYLLLSNVSHVKQQHGEEGGAVWRECLCVYVCVVQKSQMPLSGGKEDLQVSSFWLPFLSPASSIHPSSEKCFVSHESLTSPSALMQHELRGLQISPVSTSSPLLSVLSTEQERKGGG